MSRVERDPERGRAAAAKLKALGVKGILIKAAEQGYITQLACKMPECFCPEELGGACYFEPVTNEWSDWRSDWMPTLEHFPVSKKEGGKAAVDNAILAHRLCNRIDYSLRVGRSHARDLERIRKAREEGIRRNNVLTGNTEGGEIPTVVAIVEATGEPVEEPTGGRGSDAEAEEDEEGAGMEVPAGRREGAVPPRPPDDLRSHLDGRASAQGREARRLHPSHPGVSEDALTRIQVGHRSGNIPERWPQRQGVRDVIQGGGDDSSGKSRWAPMTGELEITAEGYSALSALTLRRRCSYFAALPHGMSLIAESRAGVAVADARDETAALGVQAAPSNCVDHRPGGP